MFATRNRWFGLRPLGVLCLALLVWCLALACTEGSGEGDGTGALGGTSGTGAAGAAGMAGTGVGGSGLGGSAGTATGGTAGTDSGGMAGAGTGGTGGGAGVGGGAGTAGSGGSGGGDDYVSDVSIAVHPNVNTVLVVTWTQVLAADTSWLEFTFEDGNILTSRPKPGVVGAHKDVVLGTPGDTKVTVRVVSTLASVDYKTRDYEGTTGALPSGFPLPQILTYDPALASKDRWMFGGVEDSEGGGRRGYYRFTFWTYIMDRKGRIVWYYADPETNATSSFQRLARDGEYIWIEKRPFGGNGTAKSVLKMTLDWEYFEEIPVEVGDCIDVTDDGSLLYDLHGVLKELTKAGETRDIWKCADEFDDEFDCYSNTVNWNPAGNTVLLSFPDENTVVEIDRATGMLVGKYGAAEGSYTFSPDTWSFGYEHFPNITADGTLIVSSHMPGIEEPTAGQHAFLEFEIDRVNKKLIEKWVYHEGPEWPLYKGMAVRLPGGNTLANYGTGGAIREITPDKQTAFHVKFDIPDGDDFYNKMVGNNFFLDDLYIMNGGPK